VAQTSVCAFLSAPSTIRNHTGLPVRRRAEACATAPAEFLLEFGHADIGLPAHPQEDFVSQNSVLDRTNTC